VQLSHAAGGLGVAVLVPVNRKAAAQLAFEHGQCVALQVTLRRRIGQRRQNSLAERFAAVGLCATSEPYDPLPAQVTYT